MSKCNGPVRSSAADRVFAAAAAEREEEARSLSSYSTTMSARANSATGTSSLSAFAAWRLTTSTSFFSGYCS